MVLCEVSIILSGEKIQTEISGLIFKGAEQRELPLTNGNYRDLVTMKIEKKDGLMIKSL